MNSSLKSNPMIKEASKDKKMCKKDVPNQLMNSFFSKIQEIITGDIKSRGLQ